MPITIQIAYRYLTFKEETTSAGTKTMHATGRIEGRISKTQWQESSSGSMIRSKSSSGFAVPAGWSRCLPEEF